MPKKDSTKVRNDIPAGKETPKPDDPNYEQIKWNRLSFEQIEKLAQRFAGHLEEHSQETVDLFLLLMKAYNDSADNLIVIHYMTRAAYAVSQDCEDNEGRYLDALKQRFFKIGGVS